MSELIDSLDYAWCKLCVCLRAWYIGMVHCMGFDQVSIAMSQHGFESGEAFIAFTLTDTEVIDSLDHAIADEDVDSGISNAFEILDDLSERRLETVQKLAKAYSMIRGHLSAMS